MYGYPIKKVIGGYFFIKFLLLTVRKDIETLLKLLGQR
jgi:hypothetical protein